jgi:hypothetical protein
MQTATPIAAALELPSAERQPLWRSATWLTLAQLVHSSGAFLALLLLTRREGLSAAGEFSYALALTAPLVQLLSLQLKALLLTHASQEFSLPMALTLRLLTGPAALLISVLLAVAASPLAAIWLLIRTVDAWAELFQAEHQRFHRIPAACWGGLIRTPLLLLTILAAAEPYIFSLLYLAGSTLVLVLVDARGLNWRFDSDPVPLRRWAGSGATLGLVLFLYIAAVNFPRIVLEHYEGAAALGVFAALFVLTQTGNLVASALGQSLLPLFSVCAPSRIIAWLCVPATVALVLVPAFFQFDEVLLQLLRIPASPENSALIGLTGLCQCLIWPAAMAGYALTARRLYRPLQKIAWGMLATSILLSLLIIPSAGAAGAALVLAAQSGLLLGATVFLLGSGDRCG